MSDRIQPTPKAAAIDTGLYESFGVDRVETIRAQKCVWDNKVFGGDTKEHSFTFRDKASEQEYSISGICQSCQDSFFGGSEEDEL